LDAASLNILTSLSEKPQGSAALVIGHVEIYLPLTGLIDIDEERQRLQKELKEVNSQIQRLEQLLAGPFANKAPAAVVQKERDKLSKFIETKEKLENQISAYN